MPQNKAKFEVGWNFIGEERYTLTVTANPPESLHYHNTTEVSVNLDDSARNFVEWMYEHTSSYFTYRLYRELCNFYGPGTLPEEQSVYSPNSGDEDEKTTEGAKGKIANEKGKRVIRL